MFTNRLLNLFIVIALLVIAVLLVREANATAAISEMDSATRSYIALGKALEAKRNAESSAMHSYIANVKNSECRAGAGYDMNLDSATRSYIAWGKAMEAKRNAGMDSATRSYIAWGQALQAQRNAGMDSATRSYIAWGQALQAQGLVCS